MKLIRYDIGNTKNKQTIGFCLFFKYNATKDENYHKDRLVKNTWKTIRLHAVYAMQAYVVLEGDRESRSFDPPRENW